MLLLLLLIASHSVFPIAEVVRTPYSYFGLVLVLFGIIMNLWADRLFKSMGTTVKPFEMPTAFLASGPFSISRHPMYCGMAAILLGLAVLLGSAISFVFPLLFIALMEAIFIPQEERNMFERFKEGYASYRKKVRRWV